MSEKAEKIAELVWDMLQLDPDETTDSYTRKEFADKVQIILLDN